MNRQEFIDALRQRLSEKGFPAEYVDTQCTTLTEKLNGLSGETADQYTTARNLDIIVRKLVSQDSEQIQSARSKQSESADESLSEIELTPEPTSHAKAPDVQFVDEASLSPDRRTSRVAADTEYIPCDKPRLLAFALGAICAPTILLILAVSFGLFAGVFMALAASIFLIVVAIVAIVCVGSLTSVLALLYGATQMLSTPRYVGFHEIGIGLIAAGLTIAASILLYNAAIRLVPYLYVKMCQLLKFFTRKLVSFAKNALKGVEQL